MSPDPLIPLDRDGLIALMRAAGLSPTELANRAGLTDQAVFNFLKAPAHRVKATTRIRLSRGRAVAKAFGVGVNEVTGRFVYEVEVRDVDGTKIVQMPAALAVIEADARRVRELLQPSVPFDSLPWAMNLELWRRDDEGLPLAARAEWSALWVQLAKLAAEHASPIARTCLGDMIDHLGAELLKRGALRQASGDDRRE